MARLAPKRLLSPEVRALLSYSASNSTVSTLPMIQLRRETEAEMDRIKSDMFSEVERALADAVERGDLEHASSGVDEPRFRYDTRLLMPALLTLARLHIRAGDVPLHRRVPGRTPDRDLVRRSCRTTGFITRALLDGDLRDALNDEEYEDISTNLEPPRRVAEIAQDRLETTVEEWLDDPGTPAGVGRQYSHAVTVSESHQQVDDEFGDLLRRYHSVSDEQQETVTAEIRDRYKFASPSEPPDLFDEEMELPYFVTQYERVGILYRDMLGMYESDLHLEIDDGFKRAVVLMVVAAQIGMDDTDDYEEDRGSQLTPVTAELVLGPNAGDSVAELRRIVDHYLDGADEYAPDHLTGVAVEFIRQQSLDRLDDLRRLVGGTD